MKINLQLEFKELPLITPLPKWSVCATTTAITLQCKSIESTEVQSEFDRVFNWASANKALDNLTCTKINFVGQVTMQDELALRHWVEGYLREDWCSLTACAALPPSGITLTR